MKAVINGVPHLSVLDGWWGEGFNGKNGWAVDPDANSDTQDGSDAEKIHCLQKVLEENDGPIQFEPHL